ncbi:MAG: CotH kinase family protein [Saprospiraceae bacterium]|nr:CotH kinase family protein [Saprospiraceae bacterium]
MKVKYILIIAVLFLTACKKEIATVGIPTPVIPTTASNLNPDSSHFSKTPYYNYVFPETEIRTIEIKLGQAAWDSIQRDMESLTARKFGSATTIPGVVVPPKVGELDQVPGDPIYVKAEVKQNNNNWQKVGFRLKGNASLAGSWRSGVYKLPFKLKFDEFEDQYPDIKNQRFFGFQELSFAPSYGDNTFMKEKILTDLFRKSGVMACKVAYYRVYIDFGLGSKYCGIYQVIETVEEHLVKNQRNEKVGNVYKPESTFQQFKESEFEKQNNKSAADYSDVKQLLSVLHSPLRTTNRAQWKKDLEAIFDVKEFLKYLAVNNTVGNWDSYGVLYHNSFLVNINGILHWVPYDLNLSFQMRGGLNNSRIALTFGMDEVTNQWPLIRYVVDDPEYFAFYKAAVKAFIANHFTPSTMLESIRQHKAILQPYLTGSGAEAPPYSHLPNFQSFESAVTNLSVYINDRYQAALAF